MAGRQTWRPKRFPSPTFPATPENPQGHLEPQHRGQSWKHFQCPNQPPERRTPRRERQNSGQLMPREGSQQLRQPPLSRVCPGQKHFSGCPPSPLQGAWKPSREEVMGLHTVSQFCSPQPSGNLEMEGLPKIEAVGEALPSCLLWVEASPLWEKRPPSGNPQRCCPEWGTWCSGAMNFLDC